MATNAKALLEKARREVPSWDDDFECGDDAVFRASRTSSQSPAKQEYRALSRIGANNQQHGQTRGGTATSAAEFLDAFRETENDDNMGFSSSTGRKFSQLGQSSSNTNTITSSANTTIKPNRNNLLKKWSEDNTDEETDGIDLNDATSTTKFQESSETLRGSSKDAFNNSSSIFQSTFFSPIDDSVRQSMPNRIKNTTTPGTLMHFQHRVAKKQSKIKPEPTLDDDIEFGFQDDDLTRIDASNLKRFTTNTQPAESSIFEDEFFSQETSSRRNSTTSLFSTNLSSTTESEVDGEDFLEGVVVPDAIDFNKALQARQVAAVKALEAETSEVQPRKLQPPADFLLHKPDFEDAIEDGYDEQDFFQDFDLGNKKFLINNDTLHRNVKYKDSNNFEAYPMPKKHFDENSGNEGTPNLALLSLDTLPTGPGRKPTRAASIAMTGSTSRKAWSNKPNVSPLRPQTALSQRPLDDERIIIPKNRRQGLQEFQPLQGDLLINSKRPAQSAVFSASSTPGQGKRSHALRFSKARTGKVLGDGSELDDFDDLPVDMSHEMSFTVTPIASSKTVGRHRHSSGSMVNRVSLSKFSLCFILLNI